jgi:6,7-dimethyl-8-ribityllumazine synthase
MIAVIRSRFNEEITQMLLNGCIKELNVREVSFDLFECPGSVETVGLSKKLADANKYDAIIVIGAIIKGDTDHYEYVCQYVTNGLSIVSTQIEIPLIFGILTTQTEELALVRADEEQMNKGKEFAETALEMSSIFRGIQ